jgi:phosphoribulokinase
MNYPIIGISGAARVGKDTLCRALIRFFNSKDIKAERKSIAGDTIKKDLKSLIKNKANINSFTEDIYEKTLIRPLLVEYGKLMRNQTKGRYFIERINYNDNNIIIIPDIRYAEYEEDELFWLKNEKHGFLIFVEHDFVSDANETEKINNKIIKKQADYKLKWSTLNESNPIDLEKINKTAENIGKLYLKKFTTYQSDK